jgi:hypothetical protein
MARGFSLPNPVNVNVQNNPLFVRPPYPNPTRNSAQSASELQYSPAYLYHYQNWSASAGVGALQYTFFGASVGNNGATVEDTNLLQPNNVGAGNTFIVTNMYVDLLLGVDYFSTAVEATAAGANPLDDYKSVMNRGAFQFNVNNVPQIGNGIGPLKYLASPTNILANVAVSTGSGDANAIQASTPFSSNSGYNCENDRFKFDDQTPFSAIISFPSGAVTLPSANNTTKIGVVLKGYWFRPAG